MTSSDRTVAIWHDGYCGYDFGEHPLDPVRLELTWALAGELGVLEHLTVVTPEPASDALLETVHDPAYIAAVKAAPDDPFFRGWGLNTSDNPVFPQMHQAAALITGGTVEAARQVHSGEALHAVNIGGGLHHAMRDHAAGFCVYNDPAIAICWLLDQGLERVAYVDLDVHHGDGVEAAFWDDPRVLTVSVHQSPLSLFPGTGFPEETGGSQAAGTAVNLALPPGTGDDGWLRAVEAVVPGAVRAFAPQLLLTQCGADAHRVDPLADLAITIDAQRTAYAQQHALAHELCDGRWLVTGGGGYGLVEVVPRAWTHLLAEAAHHPVPPATETPEHWRTLAAQRVPGSRVPTTMTDGGRTHTQPWAPTTEPDAVDRAIQASRSAAFPLLGLDPLDPRD